MPVPPPEDRGGPGSTDDREHPRAVRRAVPSARGTPLAAEVPLRCASGRRDASGRRRRVPGSGPVRHGIELEPRRVRRRGGARNVRRVGRHPLRGDQDPPRLPPRGRRPRRRDEGAGEGLAGRDHRDRPRVRQEHPRGCPHDPRGTGGPRGPARRFREVASAGRRRQDRDHDELPGLGPRVSLCSEGVRPARPHGGISESRASREPRGPRATHRQERRTRAHPGIRSLRRLHHGGQDDRDRGRRAGFSVQGRKRRRTTSARGLQRNPRPETSGRPRGGGPGALGSELLHGNRAGRIVRVRCETAATLFRVSSSPRRAVLVDEPDVRRPISADLRHSRVAPVRRGLRPLPRPSADRPVLPRPPSEEGQVHPCGRGEPLPADVIAQMRRAEAFGRAYEVQRQLLYATLSLLYYTRDAAGIDTTAVLREAHSRFPLIPHFEGTHFQCNFGHLNGYSAIYYTYMWSLVIAKDLFSRFRAAGSLLDPAEAERYRDLILGRGSEKPAADLIRDFLGREMRFGPFEAWVREAG